VLLTAQLDVLQEQTVMMLLEIALQDVQQDSSDLTVIKLVVLDVLLVIKQLDIVQLALLDSSKHPSAHHALLIVLQEQYVILQMVIAHHVLMDGKDLSVLFHVKLVAHHVFKILEYVLLVMLDSMDHLLVNIVVQIVPLELLAIQLLELAHHVLMDFILQNVRSSVILSVESVFKVQVYVLLVPILLELLLIVMEVLEEINRGKRILCDEINIV